MNQVCLETSQTLHEESKTKSEIGTDILRKKAGSSFLNMLHVTTDTPKKIMKCVGSDVGLVWDT